LSSRRSRCGPGGVFFSSAMMRALSTSRLSSMWDCERRPMALSFPCVNWAGAQPAFSSPIKARCRAVREPVCTRNQSDARTKVNPVNVCRGQKPTSGHRPGCGCSGPWRMTRPRRHVVRRGRSSGGIPDKISGKAAAGLSAATASSLRAQTAATTRRVA